MYNGMVRSMGGGRIVGLPRGGAMAAGLAEGAGLLGRLLPGKASAPLFIIIDIYIIFLSSIYLFGFIILLSFPP